jgi:DNA-binding transcriptional LysR family regulator
MGFMPLGLRQLPVVREVSRGGSVTAAAAALGISQPAVSMALRDAAEAAGFPLFVREQGRLQPTPETLRLMTELNRVFDGLDRVNRLVEDLRDSNVGTIQVAATPTLAENLLPRATALFQQTRPQIQITILTMDNLAAVTHVEEKRVDFGVVLSPVVHVEAQVIDLCTSELICVVHPEHALATRASVEPRDLIQFPLISFSRNLPLGALVERSFRDAGVPRRIAVEVNQSSVACSLARARAGVAIIDPFWLSDRHDRGLVRLLFRPRVEVKAHALFVRGAQLSRPARVFLACIRRTSVPE